MKQYKIYSKKPIEIERNAEVATTDAEFINDQKYHCDFIINDNNFVSGIIYKNDRPFATISSQLGLKGAMLKFKNYLEKL